MTSERTEFREFLLRVKANEMRYDDWEKFAVRFYHDDEVNSLRRQLVRYVMTLPEWAMEVGWVPKQLSDFAGALSEYLREYSDNNATFWTERYDLRDDGTLSIRTTWSDADTHSIGSTDFTVDHHDYPFWRWVVDDPARRKGLKRQRDIEELRQEFAKNEP